MKIINDLSNCHIDGKTAIAIGKFDGVHRGHRELVDRIVSQKKNGLLATIFTFDIAPEALFGKAKVWEITSLAEKRQLFAQMGVDILVEFPLTRQSAATPPEDFVRDILVGKLHSSYIAAGTDVSYGDKGLGDYKLLMKLSEELGYQVEIVDKIRWKEQEISSTLIREKISSGDMESVLELLGRPYSFKGIIGSGNHIGTKMGIPTINITPGEGKLLPPRGVYASKTLVNQRVYNGITNIGTRPTVTDSSEIVVETNLFDCSDNLYGLDMEVMLYQYVRPEQVFSGIDELKRQIHQDTLYVIKYLQEVT